MKAWHFTTDKLRDGRPLPKVGEKLVHEDELILCQSGLHGSRSILDALKYAPGCLCHRTENGGEVIQDDNKFVCSERTILWTVDATDILPKFARLCALDVIDLWDAPGDVIEFLKTGSPELAGAARIAVGGAARIAVGGAALRAAWPSGRAARAAEAAEAAWSAWDAARAAEAAWPARDAARDAARNAWGAARNAWDAWDAAWAETPNLLDKQERRLRRMIYEART